MSIRGDRRYSRPKPTKHTGLLVVQADCDDCPWRSQERNASGTAACHARDHGHTVRVEQTTVVIYNKRSDPQS